MFYSSEKERQITDLFLLIDERNLLNYNILWPTFSAIFQNDGAQLSNIYNREWYK